ncbi:MAG: hypothetical protein LBL65_00670 [Campylobacteraceae bacterium]|nr:hypothetical protein [Campylobacteraceae bacterium]
MDFSGSCFFAEDVPNSNFPHFIVIISKASPDNQALLVPISSIKPNKYYDNACVLNEKDIVADNEKNVLHKPSFIRYQWAQEIDIKSIIDKKFNGIYHYQCKVSKDVLLRIQKGAKKSKELVPYFKKYFDFF